MFLSCQAASLNNGKCPSLFSALAPVRCLPPSVSRLSKTSGAEEKKLSRRETRDVDSAPVVKHFKESPLRKEVVGVVGGGGGETDWHKLATSGVLTPVQNSELSVYWLAPPCRCCCSSLVQESVSSCFWCSSSLETADEPLSQAAFGSEEMSSGWRGEKKRDEKLECLVPTPFLPLLPPGFSTR